MIARRRGSQRVVTFLDDAVDDLRDIALHSQAIAIEAIRRVRQLERGQIDPTPLRDFAKTGDLRDCGKVTVLVDGEPEFRIVVRDVGGGRFEVVNVVAVEARADDLAYLLAGLRLERIEDPIRRSDALRRVDRIRRLRGSD